MPFPIVALLVNLAISYLLSRLQTPNGPRLKGIDPTSGDYGVPMPRAFGEQVRAPGIFMAMADIKETVHKKKPITDYIFGIVGALLPAQKTYTYSATFSLLLADRTDADPIEGVEKLWAGGKVIFSASEAAVVSSANGSDGRLMWKKYGKNRFVKSLTLYTGHDEQPVDPVLASAIGETGAYPFTAHAVIEMLQLADFGNSLPSIEVLFKNKTGESLADAAEAICAAAGIDPVREMSSSALADSVLRGYLVNNESSCWDALKPLMPVFAVDAAEVAGQIRFYDRSQSLRATIPPDDMGAHEFGDEPPARFQFRRNGDLSLPQAAELTFIDPDRGYQPNSASASRSEGDAASNIMVQLPLVLSASEGASAVSLMLWDAWLGRTEGKFNLTDKWLGLEAGLAYAVTVAERSVPQRVTRKTRGANGIIEVETVSDEIVSYAAAVIGTSGTVPDDESTLDADTRLILLDMPIISDGDDDFGFYVVMGDGAAYWPSGEIQVSGDGLTFTTLFDSSDSTAMGDVTGTLASGSTTGLDDTLDTTSTLTVVLLHDGMELESATDAELDTLKNLSFVGKDGLGEYLQFKTATKVAPCTWELTDLRRGRKGTDYAIGAHASGEEFALVDGFGVFRLAQADSSFWGTPLTFRGVTLHQDEADAATVDLTNSGEGKRPYSPVNVADAWDGSNNLTITWDARSRLNAGGLGVDDRDEYEVQITNATPVRTIVATAVESATYTAAEQAADGLIAGQVVEGRVRQTSDVNSGRWRDFVLYGPLARTADSTLITADEATLTADMG